MVYIKRDAVILVMSIQKIAKEKEEEKKRKQNTKKILLWGAQVKSVTKGESIAVRITVGSFVERLHQNTLP